jgi:hypothetical protein
MIGRTGQPEDSQNRQPEWDRQNKTAREFKDRTGRNRTHRADRTGQKGRIGQTEEDRLNRTGRIE